MAKRILVPLDQTTQSESLIPLVADLARGGGATVRLIHVAPVPDNVVSAEGRVVAYADQEMSRMEAERLDYLRTVEVQLGDIPVESVVRFGAPAAEILEEADAFGADLVVMATKLRGRVSRVILGSVADEVFRKVTTQVVLVRTAA